MKKILITGATGYIGRRLLERLLREDGLQIRLLVRSKRKLRPDTVDKVEVVEGDTFDQQALALALKGIDTAFYLIHSMGAGGDFEDLDRMSAENFREACIAAGVAKIIYLGGLGVKESASKHLASRIETGEILSAKPEKIQTIWFRAGVIIGAGSASFEIIRNLVQKLPIMITPTWVKTKTQPVGVEDVVSYLAAAIDCPFPENTIVDIGAETMSFKEMMLAAGRLMGLKRWMMPVPVLSPRLSSYWLILFTPIPYKMAAALVDGLKSETIVLNANAQKYFPQIKPRSYDTIIRDALREIEEDQVLSRWCDSSAGQFCDIRDRDLVSQAILRDVRRIGLGGATPDQVFKSMCAVGGESGWFTYNFLWRIRGLIDKLVGGYGLSRGRRSSNSLRVGDALDFWKVADIKENKRLLLLAQMKLPGKAWLEFDIQSDALVQTAHFLPRGILGRLYWYSVLPLHHFVFRDLARKIVDQANKLPR
ncbi:SDR family oxidoreductase [Desulfurivibrio alkaliphilus]|uniref:Male sterility domain protein n=1 Tax=Desulfurivibrio alkaliphilus (strain DSM 19089 / UNIQEM U267 / AHT2) TaxID=589865 RepID=D6Z123_DESAT|nr:SDR family oxidoreductase [Desulfurivibrio alkaliphilus]ADH87283.1 Male sterility domain protein [Desulfurivibrio alkaliphilus AHT 2]